jgi:hypothetical protein
LLRNRAINFIIEVEYCRSLALPPFREEGQALPPHLETSFVAFMTSISNVYRRQWPEMRAVRGIGHDTSLGAMLNFCLDVEPDRVSFTGRVHDEEDHPEGESGFSVKAEYWGRPESRVFLEERYEGSGQIL